MAQEGEQCECEKDGQCRAGAQEDSDCLGLLCQQKILLKVMQDVLEVPDHPDRLS